jgi:hypothetical protein
MDQSAFNVARKLLHAYILSENPWRTIKESKMLVLKAWDSALDDRRKRIEVQGQDRRMLTERTLPNKIILKLVCIYSNKTFNDL